MDHNDEHGEWQEYRVKARYLPGTSAVVEERWYDASLEDALGRSHAPAVLVWDSDTLNLIREEHWMMGMLQSPRSDEIPAITEYDPINGSPTKRVWMTHHEKHRAENLPAVEFLKDGKPVRHEYWVRGQLTREDGGPPVVNFDPINGEVISTSDKMDRGSQVIPRPKPSLFRPG
ncbi:hypothetical protein [Tateyamaria sp. ANG-S1]|uniref:hypothetical protein n=1 Tax=Tateyamaria sp. ANG-S1 TaxID=1577905 RepID=UPI00126A7661|nr:hypothetical protein [Tateyamaria sp. ANG-S1]